MDVDVYFPCRQCTTPIIQTLPDQLEMGKTSKYIDFILAGQGLLIRNVHQNYL